MCVQDLQKRRNVEGNGKKEITGNIVLIYNRIIFPAAKLMSLVDSIGQMTIFPLLSLGIPAIRRQN